MLHAASSVAHAGKWSLFGRRSDCGCAPVPQCKEKKSSCHEAPVAPVIGVIPAAMVALPAVAVPPQRLEALVAADTSTLDQQLRKQLLEAFSARLAAEAAASQTATTQSAAVDAQKIRELEAKIEKLNRELEMLVEALNSRQR